MVIFFSIQAAWILSSSFISSAWLWYLQPRSWHPKEHQDTRIRCRRTVWWSLHNLSIYASISSHCTLRLPLRPYQGRRCTAVWFKSPKACQYCMNHLNGINEHNTNPSGLVSETFPPTAAVYLYERAQRPGHNRAQQPTTTGFLQKQNIFCNGFYGYGDARKSKQSILSGIITGCGSGVQV